MRREMALHSNPRLWVPGYRLFLMHNDAEQKPEFSQRLAVAGRISDALARPDRLEKIFPCVQAKKMAAPAKFGRVRPSYH